MHEHPRSTTTQQHIFAPPHTAAQPRMSYRRTHGAHGTAKRNIFKNGVIESEPEQKLFHWSSKFSLESQRRAPSCIIIQPTSRTSTKTIAHWCFNLCGFGPKVRAKKSIMLYTNPHMRGFRILFVLISYKSTCSFFTSGSLDPYLTRVRQGVKID